MTTIINPDAYLETEQGRLWTTERNAEAWQKAYAALEVALQGHREGTRRVVIVCGLQGAGKTTWIEHQADARSDTIYFDAALPGIRHRKILVEIARRHHAHLEVIWINTPLVVALARNSCRAPDKRVPEASIRSVAANFEPPSPEEGFDRITIIAG